MKTLKEYINITNDIEVNEGLFSNIKNKIAKTIMKGADKLCLTAIPTDANRLIVRKLDEVKEEIKEKFYADFDPEHKITDEQFNEWINIICMSIRFGESNTASIDLKNMIWLSYFFSDKGRQEWKNAIKAEKASDGLFTTNDQMGVYFDSWLNSDEFNDNFKEMFIELSLAALFKEANLDYNIDKDKYYKQVHHIKK